MSSDPKRLGGWRLGEPLGLRESARKAAEAYVRDRDKPERSRGPTIMNPYDLVACVNEGLIQADGVADLSSFATKVDGKWVMNCGPDPRGKR